MGPQAAINAVFFNQYGRRSRTRTSGPAAPRSCALSTRRRLTSSISPRSSRSTPSWLRSSSVTSSATGLPPTPRASAGRPASSTTRSRRGPSPALTARAAEAPTSARCGGLPARARSFSATPWTAGRGPTSKPSDRSGVTTASYSSTTTAACPSGATTGASLQSRWIWVPLRSSHALTSGSVPGGSTGTKPRPSPEGLGRSPVLAALRASRLKHAEERTPITAAGWRGWR